MRPVPAGHRAPGARGRASDDASPGAVRTGGGRHSRRIVSAGDRRRLAGDRRGGFRGALSALDVAVVAKTRRLPARNTARTPNRDGDRPRTDAAALSRGSAGNRARQDVGRPRHGGLRHHRHRRGGRHHLGGERRHQRVPQQRRRDIPRRVGRLGTRCLRQLVGNQRRRLRQRRPHRSLRHAPRILRWSGRALSQQRRRHFH